MIFGVLLNEDTPQQALNLTHNYSVPPPVTRRLANRRGGSRNWKILEESACGAFRCLITIQVVIVRNRYYIRRRTITL
jgi:hypothetical protein